MSEMWAVLIGVCVGGAITFATSYYFYFRQRKDELRALAASLATEVEHLLEGLKHYGQALEGARSAAFHLQAAVGVIDPPFRESNFRVFVANVGHIGRFDPRVARGIVGFYHVLETMPERAKEINDAVNRGGDSAELAIEVTKSYINALDTTSRAGEAIRNELRVLENRSNSGPKLSRLIARLRTTSSAPPTS